MFYPFSTLPPKGMPCVAHGNASLAGKEASACLKETLCVWVWKAFLCVVGGIPLYDAKHFLDLREYILTHGDGRGFLTSCAAARTTCAQAYTPYTPTRVCNAHAHKAG